MTRHVQTRVAIGALFLALTQPPARALDLTPYLPVTDGNTWTFLEDFQDLTNGDRETFITLAGFQGTDLVDGVTTHRFGVYGEIDPAGDVVDITNLAWDAEGLQTYRLLSNDDSSEPLVEATAGDLELMLPRAMEIGETVTDSARFEAYQQGRYFGFALVTNRITLEGLETLDVPAGVFETLRISSREEFQEHDADGVPVGTRITDRRSWLAAGIGFVKQEENERYDDRYGDGYERSDTVTLLAAVVDGTLVGNSTYIDNIERVYIAYYGRPGDPDGTVYWTGRFANNDGVWGELIGAFAASQEAQERFGGLDNETLLRNLYQQMFNREPDDAGLAYYLGELDTGARTLEGIMLDVLNGASGGDKAIVDNKLDVARYFTEQVRAQGKAYGGDDIPAARNVLDQVSADPASIDTARAQADQTIAAMVDAGACGPGLRITLTYDEVDTTIFQGFDQPLLPVPNGSVFVFDFRPEAKWLSLSPEGQTLHLPVTVTQVAGPRFPPLNPELSVFRFVDNTDWPYADVDEFWVRWEDHVGNSSDVFLYYPEGTAEILDYNFPVAGEDDPLPQAAVQDLLSKLALYAATAPTALFTNLGPLYDFSDVSVSYIDCP